MTEVPEQLSFVGTLSIDEKSWPITIRATLTRELDLELDIPRIPYTAATVEIERAEGESKSARNFTFEGISKEGETLSSRSLRFNSWGHHSNPEGDFLTLGGEFLRAVLAKAIEPEPRPAIRQYLRNCQGMFRMEEPCSLGTVNMRGSGDIQNLNAISGWLQVIGPEEVRDRDAWRREGDALLLHVVRVMSFATARPIKVPLTQTWLGDRLERTILSQTEGGSVGQPVAHPMDQKAIFKAAVQSFFKPAIVTQGLDFAMEWFAMPASYTEMRLLHAMTALEILTEQNLKPSDSFCLPEKRFKILSATMRRSINDMIDGEAERFFRDGLKSKMRDLNRRSLFEKVLLLVERWGVSLQGFELADLRAAIKARDRIVHQGRYYDDAPGNPAQTNLWEHILNVRELAARLVFAALGFQGSYLSFIGRQHERPWPPA